MRVLKDLSPEAIRKAIEWNVFGLFACLIRMPGARVEHGPDMMRVITGIPHELLNGIFHADLDGQDVDAFIEDALDEFRSRDLPMIWWTGPLTRPGDIGTHLERHRLVRVGEMVGMAADLQALGPELPEQPELSVEPVRDEVTLQQWIAPLLSGFDFPEAARSAFRELFLGFGFGTNAPFRNFVGRWRGRSVATCSMFFGAGVAGTHVTVEPEYRGRGIAATITSAGLREAADLGYRVGVTQTTQLGVGLHRRLGFGEYCRLGLYVPRTGAVAGTTAAALRASG